MHFEWPSSKRAVFETMGFSFWWQALQLSIAALAGACWL
jgi:hypothetical protein